MGRELERVAHPDTMVGFRFYTTELLRIRKAVGWLAGGCWTVGLIA